MREKRTLRAQCFLPAIGFLFGCCTNTRASVAEEREPLVALLRSETTSERSRGYEIAAARRALSADEIRALIGCLRYPDQPVKKPRHSPYGPETTETRPTQILVGHGEQAFPLLLEALSDRDWNTRRYVAFCLGRICNDAAIPPLRRALGEEVVRASSSSIQMGERPRAPLLSVVGAMVDAYARLDRSQAFEWALGLFVADDHDFHNLVANYALARIAGHVPEGFHDEAALWSGRLRKSWMEWWRADGKRPGDQRFRVEECTPPTEYP
jgi:hypothetical protein